MNNAHDPSVYYLWCIYLILIICRGKWHHFFNKPCVLCLWNLMRISFLTLAHLAKSLLSFFFQFNFVNNTAFLQGKQISCLRLDSSHSLQPPSNMSPCSSFCSEFAAPGSMVDVRCHRLQWLSLHLQRCFIAKYLNCFLNSLSSEHSH